MGIETWNQFPTSLATWYRSGMPLPCSDINPRLKCKETRWARDYCIASGGQCEYKIEAHFDCLEEFYPKDKVEELRREFKPNILDIPTSDVYLRYRHYYIGVPGRSKTTFNGHF